MGLLKIVKTISLPTKIMISFCVLYGLAGTLVSLHRFWQYEVFYDSYGIFDSVIWQVSRFQMPMIDHIALGRLPIFADHFYPTMFILSPLYWFTNRSELLGIVQALTVTGSGWVLYIIAKQVLKQPWLSFGITVSYLLFVGLQNAIITDFHDVTIATLPLMLIFWAIVTDRKKLFFVFLVLTLGCKESMSITGICIGIFLLSIPSWRTVGIETILISSLWGITIIKCVIPYFSNGVYIYTPQMPYSLTEYVMRFFDTPDKRRTLWYSFQSFLFLPIFAPTTWPLLLQDFFIRFVPLKTNMRWTLGMHYNAQTAVFLAIGSLYGLKNILKPALTAGRFFPASSFLYLFISLSLVLNALYLHQRVLHGPLGLSYNKAFYTHTKDFAFLDRLIVQVPKNVSVMTQNNLAVRFTHQTVYLPDMNYDKAHPDYIVLDLRDGQNPNNFFGSHAKSIEQFVGKLQSDPKYELITDPSSSQKIWQHK